MNLERISKEVEVAQEYFDYLELFARDRQIMVKLPFNTTKRTYVMEIRFPESYPNGPPTVHVRVPQLNSPVHMWGEGQICYMLPRMWNPGAHDLMTVIARTAKWLTKYEVFRETGSWPGAEIQH